MIRELYLHHKNSPLGQELSSYQITKPKALFYLIFSLFAFGITLVTMKYNFLDNYFFISIFSILVVS